MDRIAFACLVVAACALPAFADQPWPYTWTISVTTAGEVSIWMAPDGSGPALAEARVAGGTAVDATITVQLITIDGDPFVGLPRESVWLQWLDAPGQVTGCTNAGAHPGGMFYPDDDSDVDGLMTFRLPLHGGGWSDGAVTLYICGSPAQNAGGWQEAPLAVRVNSPDITGDRLVNLSDITLFTQDLGAYAYRSDFNWDSAVNLSDVVVFTPAIGVTCP